MITKQSTETSIYIFIKNIIICLFTRINRKRGGGDCYGKMEYLNKLQVRIFSMFKFLEN